MNNYVLLAACMLLGVLLHRSGRLPANAAASLNGFVIHISLPALTLTYVHGLTLNANLILPALMAWVMFAIGCGFFWLVGRALRFSRATTGGLMLTGGLANTSFIGLPMIETFYGPQFLGLGILISRRPSSLPNSASVEILRAERIKPPALAEICRANPKSRSSRRLKQFSITNKAFWYTDSIEDVSL